MNDLAPRSVRTPSLLAALTDSTGDWIVHARCAGMDPELFFPERGESTEEARAACRVCPVRRECLDYAMAAQERFGVWGGLSERERRRMRRQRRILDVPA